MKRLSVILAATVLCLALSGCSILEELNLGLKPDQPTTQTVSAITEKTTDKTTAAAVEEISQPEDEPLESPTDKEPNEDPYVAMLRSSSYYAKGAESQDFSYLIYTCSRNDSGYIVIKEYLGDSRSVTLPDTMDGFPVIGVWHSLFDSCPSVSEVYFPGTLRSIIFNSNADTDTFMVNTAWYAAQSDGIYYAGSIAAGYKGAMPADTILTFREGTTGIGGGAFRLQKELVGIEIPASMVMIDKNAFGGSGLKEVAIPTTLQHYFGAFDSCNHLTRVTFEDSVTEIRGTFSGDKLSDVVLPDTLVTIGKNAFMDCEGLKKIVLPAGVEYIDDHAFYGSGLEEIELNDGLYSIGKEAFMRCTSLKSLYIPASVKETDVRAIGYNWDDELIDGFTAYFPEECPLMEHLQDIGLACEIRPRS